MKKILLMAIALIATYTNGMQQSADHPLLLACTANNFQQVEEVLLNLDIQTNTVEVKNSALKCAITHENLPMCELLISYGAELPKNILIDVIYNIKNDNAKLVKFLIINGANPNESFQGDTPLTAAIDCNREKICAVLLKHGANPNGGYTRSPLLVVSAKPQRIKIAKMLVDAGADINYINYCDRRALIMICSCRNEEFCKLLIESGVELYKSGAARYALANLEAIQNGTAEFSPQAEILLRNITLIHRAVLGSKALFRAIKQGNFQAIAEIAKPLNVTNLPDEQGFTPLYKAIEQGNLQMCLELLKWGANPNARDANELTALDHASVYKHPEIFELLQIYAKDTLKNRCIRAIIETTTDNPAPVLDTPIPRAQLKLLLPGFIEIAEKDTIETEDPFGSWTYAKKEKEGIITLLMCLRKRYRWFYQRRYMWLRPYLEQSVSDFDGK